MTGDAPGWSAPAPEAVLYLHERRVRTVGIDALSIGFAHDPVPVYQEGLCRGVRYVEVLTNLGELPARGAYIESLPLKIAGSSGGPGAGDRPAAGARVSCSTSKTTDLDARERPSRNQSPEERDRRYTVYLIIVALASSP